MSRVAGVGHGIVTGSNARMCRPGMPLMARRFPGELARPSPPSEADSLVLAAAVAGVEAAGKGTTSAKDGKVGRGTEGWSEGALAEGRGAPGACWGFA